MSLKISDSSLCVLCASAVNLGLLSLRQRAMSTVVTELAEVRAIRRRLK
ncbi:hypothetical protein LC613_13115 [Nostoc sphaeroides CHAB 2801]|nr:hypothetical protein [Nostoc sphaeroides]MCC5628972.1 hypothetical protein [Nostoc sphaeroides CHAB 2801]